MFISFRTHFDNCWHHSFSFCIYHILLCNCLLIQYYFILNLRFPKKKKSGLIFLLPPLSSLYDRRVIHYVLLSSLNPSLQYLLPTSDLIFNFKRLSVVLKYIAFKGFYLISILWTGGNTKTIESNRNFNSLLGWKFSITDSVLTPCDYGIDCWQWRLDN